MVQKLHPTFLAFLCDHDLAFDFLNWLLRCASFEYSGLWVTVMFNKRPSSDMVGRFIYRRKEISSSAYPHFYPGLVCCNALKDKNLAFMHAARAWRPCSSSTVTVTMVLQF
jgi:hypothetical protein